MRSKPVMSSIQVRGRSRLGARALGAAFCAALVGSACGSRLDDGLHSTDTGNPPVVDSARISAQLEGSAVVVTGERGAVPPRADVRIRNSANDAAATAAAAADGSFEVSVEGGAGDSISLSVDVDGETSVITLDVPVPDDSLPSNPSYSAAPPVSPASMTDAGATTVPRDVDWPNVDWGNSYAVVFTASLVSGLGLWMGTGISDPLPTEQTENPPYALDASPLTLRLTGDAPTQGGDIYLHTAFPVEGTFQGVYFNARSSAVGGQTLRVTLGGPEERYWADVNAGESWPVWELNLSDAWSKHELTFAELGFDPKHLSPYSDPWGALHFLVSPEQAYDVELFDLVFINFEAD